MKITPDTARRLRALLDHVRDGRSAIDPEMRSEAAALLHRLEDRNAPAKNAVASVAHHDGHGEHLDQLWREFVEFVHDAVWELSRGHCESCGRPLRRSEGDMDHARGGAHRREYTRIEWCRRLCRKCHQKRTANDPDADFWLSQMGRVRAERLARMPERFNDLSAEEARLLEAMQR